MPSSVRRRFLVMLWLSLALHALVIGLTQLPPPVQVPQPRDLRVELSQPVPAESPAVPMREAGPAVQAIRPPLPRQGPVPSAVLSESLPQPAAPTALPPPPHAALPAPSAPAVAPAREAPGPVLDVPLLADMRYYPARELDVQPAALRKPQPAYPARAEEQGVAGRVVVRLHLEADGSISRTEVMSVAPAGVYGEMFRKATLYALRDARFRPALRNGQPVRAVVEIPVVFEPDE
jgi:protein TonB